MFECWTADRVWISFLFLTTWKLSHLIKTKFIENEKRVLKKNSKKKSKEEKKRNLSPTRFELAPLDEKNKEIYWIYPLDHASKGWKIRLKTGTYSISTMIDSFQEYVFRFLYNYGIFNWT